MGGRTVRPRRSGPLRFRGHVVRWLPPRKTPNFFTDRRNRTHPRGYEIAELGPPRLVDAERRKLEGRPHP